MDIFSQFYETTNTKYGYKNRVFKHMIWSLNCEMASRRYAALWNLKGRIQHRRRPQCESNCCEKRRCILGDLFLYVVQFAPRVNSVKTSHLFFDFIDITFSEKILNEKSVNPAVRMSSVTLNACILGKKSPKLYAKS